MLGCKDDCDFERMLSVESNFTSGNSVQFALNVADYLQSDVAAECSEYFPSLSSSLQNVSAAQLLDNISI